MVCYTAAALLGLAASVSARGAHHNHAALHNRAVEQAPVPYGAPIPHGVHVKYVTPIPQASAMPQASAKPNATSCECVTYTTTWYGEPTLGPGPTNTSTPTSYPTANVSSVPVATYSVSTTEAPKPTTPATSETPKPTTTPAASETPKPTTTPVASEAPKPTTTPAAPAAPAAPETPKSPETPPQAPQAYAPQGYGSPNKGSDQNKDGKDDSAYGVGAITPNGNQWAMTYTPYAQDGTCKSADSVNQDIESIKSKGFTTVRLYATDCSGLVNAGNAAKQHGMKIIAGIFIDSAGLGKAHEQLNEIANWGKQGNWNTVEMVVAGNEAVFQGAISAGALAGFLGDAKSTLKSAGYNGPVTTTEPLSVIQANAGTLCPAMDVAAANIHPFFNGGFSASEAGDFVESQLHDLEKACNKDGPAYILETGWPSSGQANNKAIPGPAEQKAAIDGIVAKVGSRAAIFAFEDDKWKAPGEYGVEQSWGCSKLFSS